MQGKQRWALVNLMLAATFAVASAYAQTGPEAVCKAMKGDFRPPSFCIVTNSWFYEYDGVVKLPERWMCAHPPYDQDPSFGSCTNPKTGKFDLNYCAIVGLPPKGCNLVHKPILKPQVSR